MSKAPSAKMRVRMIGVVVGMTVLGFLVLIIRLFQLQVIDGQMYQQRALGQQLRTTTIAAARGTIYDANGLPLATSATVWNVFLSPADLVESQLDSIAQGLSEILDVEEQTILDAAEKTSSYYEVIKRKIEQDVHDEVVAFIQDNGIKGVYMEEDTKRYYPYGDLASTVLGFTNSDGDGAYGLESYYDNLLSGTDGQVVSLKDAWGGDMTQHYQEMYSAQDGYNITLTIDETIQHYLEKHLEAAVVEQGVKERAVGIVMDVNTGAILAMATENDFDPNEPTVVTDPDAIAELESYEDKDSEEYLNALSQAQYDQWRNKAISDPYEPGSVFKLITAAAALETNAVSLTDTFYCPGYHIVAGVRIGCWYDQGHGTQDMAAAVRHSCNPAFMMIGERLGAERFYEYFEAFGLTEPTGIDIPGEAIPNPSLYHSLESLKSNNGIQLASSSFGQTFKVTPLQLITAVSATINGGYLMKPYVVAQVTDQDGNIVSTTEPTVVRQVISEETSAIIRDMGEQVVANKVDGSGKNAYVPGYRIGGKTGTSEKLDEKEDGVVTKRISSFLGFAPANDPQIAVLVMLDDPQLLNVYGSIVAAPVVANIMSDVLPYLGIEPQYTEEELANMDVAVENYVGQVSQDALATLVRSGLQGEVVGDSGTIVKQIPAYGQTIPKNGTVILYTDKAAEETVTTTMPNLIGLNAQQVNQTLTNARLNLSVGSGDISTGTAIAVKQSIGEGETVEIGTVITVDFISTDVEGVDKLPEELEE